jgi:hypothetical protein
MGLMTVTIRRRIMRRVAEDPRATGSTMLTATSIARIVVPSLALVAAGGAAFFFGITHVRREPPVEARSVTAARVANAALAVAHRSSDTGDEFTPVFDIARIDPAGDAVIAGSAAPGASVELLRNGKVHDRAVADQFGQFVMVPPRLPPGDYELTLRSRQPDGREATSKQSVGVALQPSLKDQTVVRPRRWIKQASKRAETSTRKSATL